MQTDKSTAEFPEPEDLGPREWGKEWLLVKAPGKYIMKLIEMNAGAAGGLQEHHLKDEAGYMIYGEMRVIYDLGNGLTERIVRQGEAFRFPTGAVHQIIAISNCAYVECSTPHFNDRIHVEHRYGIPVEAGGLPSTKIEDVITA
jgi:quercetin dioxygenase-like cupin family protein